MADHDDRGTRALDGREDVICGRPRCEPVVDAQVDAGRFCDRGSGLAGAQERAREDSVGLNCAKELTQFPCLLPPACSLSRSCHRMEGDVRELQKNRR